MARLLILLLVIGLTAPVAARMPAPGGLTAPVPVSQPPETLTAYLEADGLPLPEAVTLLADSLLIGALQEIRLEFVAGAPETPPALATKADWLQLGGSRRSADGTALLVQARIYRTGPCVIAWRDERGPISPVYEIAGRLAPDAQPHAVRDPRSLGLHILRIILAILLVLLLLLTVFRLLRRRRVSVGLPEISFTAPAWMVAARELLGIQEANLPARGETRLFLHLVDLALRRYLGLRHGTEATEMTTSEVVAMLESSTGDPETPVRAGGWLRDCDRLRFASGEVRPEDCQRLLVAAVREIERTRETECPPDVPGDWRYESELCWSRLLSALPRLDVPAAGGTDA